MSAPPQGLGGPTADDDEPADAEDAPDQERTEPADSRLEPAEPVDPEREQMDDLPPAYLDIDETFPMKAQPRRAKAGVDRPTPAQASTPTFPTQAPAFPMQVPAFPTQAAHPTPTAPEEGGRNRTAIIIAVVVAVLAVAALVGVGVLVLNRDTAGPATPTTVTPSAVAAVGPPPDGLTLKDDSATITLSWTDPAGGGVPFMVAGGRAGQALGVLATVDPGKTRYTVNGLNSRLDYCFTVLAVYSTDSFATSGQVCTKRESDTPST